MAKPNYSYEKRQRELAKKRKKEEKRKRKAGIQDDAAPEGAPEGQPKTPGEESPVS